MTQNKKLLIFAAIAFVVGVTLSSIGNKNQTASIQQVYSGSVPTTIQNLQIPSSLQTPQPQQITKTIPPPATTNIVQPSSDPGPQPASGLSNDNYYINSQNNQVHSPSYSNTGDVPAGASAQCRDGTYSFSQNRRGTCSHHGGVATWY